MSDSFVLSTGLDHDLLVLEASAGTGKTFALAGLSTLAVGRGDARIGELCVATFTEAATAELRGRLRQRIAEAVAFLDAARTDPADELDAILVALDPVARDEWLDRLRVALRDFDTASITTIHGFCSRVVGAVAGLGTGARLTSDSDDVDEVVRDRLLQRFGATGVVDVDHGRLLAVVRQALSLPAARLQRIDPASRVVDDAAARAAAIDDLAELVRSCVDEVRARRRARQVRTFDDLLADTRELLLSADGPAVATELRRRYRVVLVDEFQDTDQVQWDILRRAFVEPVPGAEHTRMVIVGDPKQSIYRFRGAELSAYLSARRHALAHGGAVASLATNYRTDEPLLQGLNALFGTFGFGTDVQYRPVGSPLPDGGSRCRGVGGAPLQFRSVVADVSGADAIREVVTRDLCDVVVDLLRNGEVQTDDGEWRGVEPSDIGILVTSNQLALDYAAALRARDVPAVASSSDSVLASAAAGQWRTLLDALEHPGSDGAVRRAALSWFDSFDATTLAALDRPDADDRLAELFDRYRDWSRLLTDSGLPALLGALRAHGLSRRVLSRRGGERDLTDVEHIAELLQSRTAGRPTTAGTLLEIVDELAEATRDEATTSDLYDRRIDRDDDTVRIMTVHKAKGLEFEIVLVPSMWGARKKGERREAHATLRDDAFRTIDVDQVLGDGPVQFDEVATQQAVEDAEEDRRKLYVALTRAKHRMVVWAPLRYTWSSGVPVALRDLLAHGRAKDFKGFDPASLVDAAGGTVEFVEAPAEAPPLRWTPVERPERRLDTAVAPSIDRTWRRWSYTGVTRSLAEADLPALPEVAGGLDEPSTTADELVEHVGVPDRPLRTVPGGKVFGTLVHGVLERVDFVGSDEDVTARLAAECARSLRYQTLRGVDAGRLATGLAVALRAPLGGPLGSRSLRDLSTGDRRNELVFDLPLARFDTARLADVVLPHLAADDPFAAWFAAATHRHLTIEGMLNGSIDLVARTSIDGRDRYWVADYKTNVIAEGIDFDQQDLVAEMIRDDYVLQATVYQVALHRFLRWRLGPAYDPDADLLGSAYLFVRGMDPSRPADDTRGVMWWRLPTPALLALDALFADGEVAA